MSAVAWFLERERYPNLGKPPTWLRHTDTADTDLSEEHR